LTKINLERNEIGADGTKYISQALQHNTVNYASVHLRLNYLNFSRN